MHINSLPLTLTVFPGSLTFSPLVLHSNIPSLTQAGIFG